MNFDAKLAHCEPVDELSTASALASNMWSVSAKTQFSGLTACSLQASSAWRAAIRPRHLAGTPAPRSPMRGRPGRGRYARDRKVSLVPTSLGDHRDRATRRVFARSSAKPARRSDGVEIEGDGRPPTNGPSGPVDPPMPRRPWPCRRGWRDADWRDAERGDTDRSDRDSGDRAGGDTACDGHCARHHTPRARVVGSPCGRLDPRHPRHRSRHPVVRARHTANGIASRR